jgi:glucose-1-phosphate thymidylyltransferase
MKGIILAGGSGTRLYPATLCACKQLLPVYDKPLIYYPLSTLMLAGIKDVLIISTPRDLKSFIVLLRNGLHLGINITYQEQPKPNGLAEAFILGEEFIGEDSVCLILGDNIFYGHGLTNLLNASVNRMYNGKGAIIFGYYVNDPERYGVVEIGKNGVALSLEEKPRYPKSNYAVTGLYFYDNTVIDIAKNLEPSKRGELEITDINKIYLKWGRLRTEILGRGFAWLDTGTHESLLEASTFVEVVEKRQGLKIACLEEIAYLMGYITKQDLKSLADSIGKNQYGQYLSNLLRKEI